jgi:hypothetical protein
MDAAPTDELPEFLQVAADVGGLQLAAALAKVFGGSRLYLPQPENIDADHAIAKALAAEGVSLDHARALAGARPGWVDVPFGPFVGVKASLRKRRAVATRALRDGATKHQAARASGLTERSIYRIQAETSESNQPDLFKEG